MLSPSPSPSPSGEDADRFGAPGGAGFTCTLGASGEGALALLGIGGAFGIFGVCGATDPAIIAGLFGDVACSLGGGSDSSVGGSSTSAPSLSPPRAL
jgi:hypothetical protein